MNRFESKYFNTALLFNEALLQLLQVKDFEFITVKDVCEKAGVNRSTFYLHYDNTNDLLKECIENINKKFIQSFDNGVKDKFNLTSKDTSDLVLITPDYLTPYLEFIKSNKIVLKAYYNHPELMGSNTVYNKMFEKIFKPILKRFSISDQESEYMMAYYLSGVMAIVMKWVEGGCKEETSEIVNLIIKCVRPYIDDKK
jgi:AcrR family transcriptional regulator